MSKIIDDDDTIAHLKELLHSTFKNDPKQEIVTIIMHDLGYRLREIGRIFTCSRCGHAPHHEIIRRVIQKYLKAKTVTEKIIKRHK